MRDQTEEKQASPVSPSVHDTNGHGDDTNGHRDAVPSLDIVGLES